MSLKILIVEDEAIIAEDIATTLKSNDYEVLGKAFSVQQALDMIYTRHPDLILLDISLKSDMDGIDIATIIRDKYKLPFIFITAFSDSITLERAKYTMPYGYIVKPFKDKDLLAAIEMAHYRYTAENVDKLPLVNTINKIYSTNISKTEYSIINLIWEGKTNAQIAESVFVSINTIKTHISSIFQKLNVHSKIQLVNLLRQMK